MTKGSIMEKSVESLVESVDFIIQNMATKDDLAKMEFRLGGVEQKLDGISNRLEYELDRRHQLEVRVTTLEKRDR